MRGRAGVSTNAEMGSNDCRAGASGAPAWKCPRKLEGWIIEAHGRLPPHTLPRASIIPRTTRPGGGPGPGAGALSLAGSLEKGLLMTTRRGEDEEQARAPPPQPPLSRACTLPRPLPFLAFRWWWWCCGRGRMGVAYRVVLCWCGRRDPRCFEDECMGCLLARGKHGRHKR
jgi:hypothetical protein